MTPPERAADSRRPPSVGDVLTYLLNRQLTTRREIAEHTGLSAAAVSKALQQMLAAGLITETSMPRAAGLGAGRPTQQVRIVPGRVTVAGIKLTADQLIVVVTDLSGGVVEERTVGLDPGGLSGRLDVAMVVDRIADVVAELSARYCIDQIVLAVSGDVDSERGVVVLSPLLGWQNVALGDRLAARIKPPVIIDNDIRALTAAELALGDAFGLDSFAVVTIGEGIGCGLVVNGQVVRGAFGVAGELGHMIIDRATDEMPAASEPTASGRLEQLISRSAVMDRARGAGTVANRFSELIAAAESGDVEAGALLQKVGTELGVGVANMVNLVGPARLVISTEGFDLDTAFGPIVDETIRRHAFGQARRLEIIHREIPFTEWARGAAVVALNRYVLSI